jgi:hypothetical protein
MFSGSPQPTAYVAFWPIASFRCDSEFGRGMADSGESSARQIYGFTTWLPAGHVFLEHADVPLVNEVANARTYLAIVRDAVRKMSKSDDHPLSVVFPNKSRE